VCIILEIVVDVVWRVSFIFATIDSNAAGDEGGGDFGGFEEDD
jgi:hypothetical protein